MVLDDLRPSHTSHSGRDSAPLSGQEELRRLNRELRAISNCNQTLMRAVDEATLLQDICRIVCEEAGYRMAWVGYAEHDEAKTVRPVASAGFDDGYIAAAQLTWSEATERGRGPGGRAIRDGETLYVQDIESDLRMAPWRESAVQHGYGSTIALPLKADDGKAFGVLLIYSEESEVVTPDELRLLEELAGDLAFGITVLRARRERKRVESIMMARMRLLEFAGSHSMDELLTASLDEIEALTGSTIGFYHFVEPDQTTLSLQNWSTNTLKNMCKAEGKGSHYGIEQAGVWVDCVHERRPIIHNDYASLAHKKGLPEGHAPVVREAVVPIFRGNLIKAIIGVGNKATNYDENDIEIVSQLGDLSWDITERKVIEQGLRESEEKFEAAFTASPSLVAITRLTDGKIIEVNPSYSRLLGYSRAESIGRTTSDLFIWANPADRATFQTSLKEFGQIIDFETKLQRKDGTQITVLDSARIINLHGETCVLSVAHDITERKRMEEALAIREREFRTLAENSPDVVVRYDRECRRIYVNPAFERVNRLTSQQVLGIRPVELSTELAPMAVPFTQRLMEVMETGIATQVDLQWAVNGEDKCWFVRVIPEFGAAGEVVSALTIWTNITERKQLEMALRQSEQKFRSLAENSPENIFRYDDHCRIIYANHQVKKTLLSNGESFLGRTPLEKSPEGHYPGGVAEMEHYQVTLQRVVASGELADVEMHVPDASGAMRTHSVRFTPERDRDGNIVGALAFGRDITEKTKLEEQLRQSQKMEAIGQLAGGVAHDFNNILTAIMGFGNLAKMKMKPDDPQQTLIDHILAASDRAAHLTHSLLAFSRKQVLLPKPVDLNAIVQGVGKLLGRLIGEDIELVARVADQSLIVMADEGQIEQVLMNLATNARDAMPDGGALTISTESRLLGADFTSSHGFGKVGSYALVTVSDTGKGMDAATRERVFEPFFTTKSPEKGTGLGLSMVYGIIKQHDGFINVYSEPGKGTTFRIYLPLVAMATEQVHPERSAPPTGGTERLLLAEDDPVVRTLISGILRDFGYHVIEAVDGMDALEKITAQAEGIDLLILDVIMPKMSGKDVYDTVRRMGGRQKTLFISGYTADFINRKGVFGEGAQFLAKPVSPFELLKKIRNILDERQQSGPG